MVHVHSDRDVSLRFARKVRKADPLIDIQSGRRETPVRFMRAYIYVCLRIFLRSVQHGDSVLVR